MKILALECAAGGCAACLWHDGAVIACVQEKMERGQDARLVPLVQGVMKQAGCSFDALDLIAASRGPGSFTGLRIGLAAARGFALASGKRVVGIDRFAIYKAQRAVKNENLLIVLESRRLELYTRFYPASGEVEEARLRTPDEITQWAQLYPKGVIVGDAQESLAAACGALPCPCEAAMEPEVVTCAALAAQVLEGDPAFLPRPLYLRAPDVTIKACGGG